MRPTVFRLLIVASLVISVHGTAWGQGWFDSILGPGGLGLWGGDTTGQFTNPQFYGGGTMQGSPMVPPQTQQQMPQAYGYPQGYSYPQGYDYATQPGVHADWYSQPPATMDSSPPPQYTQPQPYAQPQQYFVPSQPQQPMAQQPGPQPPGPQYPGQQQYGPQPQYPPQQFAAPQPPAGQQRQRSQARRQPTRQAQQPLPPGPPLRPGQYSPVQQPGPVSADDLPPGAVQITTTTPDGTRVQYFPPAFAPGDTEQGVAPPGPQARPRAVGPGRQPQQRPRQQVQQPMDDTGVAPIAMPRPVEIPQDRDPRTGWGPAMNRAPGDSSRR